MQNLAPPPPSPPEIRAEHSIGPSGERCVDGILQPDGTLAPGASCPLADDALREALRLMTYSRLVDERGVSYQRQGRIGTFAEVRGQEGASAGSALALDPAIDWVAQSYRELPALLHQGLSIVQHWLMYIGHPRGWATPMGVNVLPLQIELAAQIPQAVGLAWGMQLQGKPGAVLAYFGDGASSEGDFYEAANLAGVTTAPVVLFCQNNGWAISTPRGRQTRAATIAAKAAAAGIPGYVVDGNDVMAVYAVTAEAIHAARNGDGPTLIEAQTYRIGAHNTSDDLSRYAPPEQQTLWLARDPLDRLRRYLLDADLWDEASDLELRERLLSEIDEAFVEAERVGADRSASMLFDHVYANPPRRLTAQQAQIEKEGTAWPS